MSKKNKNKTSEVIIIGAGPAGMTAALACARGGLSVLLLEKNAQIGKKILSTGNGKCNLTNLSQKREDYRSEEPDFAWRAYEQFNIEETFSFFQSLGIYTKERNGYVYPYNEQAAAVREAFEVAIETNPLIEVRTDACVTGISYKNERFRVFTEEGSYTAKNVLLSVGGSAAPKLGSNGDGYAFAKAFGHRIIKPLPALMALKSGAPFLKKLSGVRNQAKIALLIDGKEVSTEQGELQWTDYGISGVAIFQLSRYAVVALEQKRQVTLELDLFPALSKEELEEQFKTFQKNCSYKNMRQFMTGFLPVKLCPVILREARIEEEQSVKKLKKEEWQTLVNAIKHFSLRINGTMDFDKAQTTRGGVCVSEVTEHMESKLCEGLFFAGELLDVDGTCGGYNLQWAFTSGMLAAQGMIKRKEQKYAPN